MKKILDMQKDVRSLLQDALDKARDISLQGYDIIIWGAGNTTELNRKTIMEENLLPAFFMDSDNRKWGSFKWDVEIIPPDEIKKRCANPMVLISSAEPRVCNEIVECLKRMEIPCYYMIDAVIWGRHSEELLSVYDMLASQYSKELFTEIILSRMEGKEIPEKCVSDNQYFAKKDFKLRNSKEIFVDCGAYVGDTVEQYLYMKEGVFGKIYAFEPDLGNADALSKRVERLKGEWNIAENRIHIINGAVGKEDGRLFVTNDVGGLAAKVTGTVSDNEIQVYEIDSFFKDIPVGFLKADVEGCELDILEGAAATIKKHKPLLAICIYHQSSDLYKIPMFIKRLNEDYQIDIAHHYYNYTETVLYASKSGRVSQKDVG